MCIKIPRPNQLDIVKMDSSDSFINSHHSQGADVAQVVEWSPSNRKSGGGHWWKGGWHTLQSRHFYEGTKCVRECITECSACVLNDQANKNIIHKCNKFPFCSQQIFMSFLSVYCALCNPSRNSSLICNQLWFITILAT